ncbi:MAG: L,D-transpeptidase [Candidatus Cloacimonetes bacterium]|jgi:hypothetical protein|nr:L,D-transpeptidase [Candidatus Cloacimonadota bacterium]
MIKYEKVILISIKDQKLILIQDNCEIAEYSISTSKFGIGNKAGSNMTPLGYHLIKEKIGDHIPTISIFKAGEFTKEIAKINDMKAYEEDLITTRIIKLEGMEKGINKGGEIDSYERGIWIHGTPAESKIGTPASHGCIRMKNDDIVLLYNSIEIGTPINIEMKMIEKVQNKNDLFADRRHTFRLIDRRKQNVFDSSLWKLNSRERRKEDERRNR